MRLEEKIANLRTIRAELEEEGADVQRQHNAIILRRDTITRAHTAIREAINQLEEQQRGAAE